MKERKKIKIAILLDSFNIPQWQFQTIERLSNFLMVSIDLVVLNKTKKPITKNYSRILRKILYLLYEEIDMFLFGKGINLFKPKNSKNLFKNSKTLYVSTFKKGISTYIEEKDVENIKSYNLDIIIRFGFGILKGNILEVPKLGVWSFHHGDNKEIRGSSPCFWELYYKKDVIGLTLQILSNELDGGKVIYKSFSSLDRFSLIKNRKKIYSASIFGIERVIKRYIATESFNYNEKKLDIYDNPLYKNPTNYTMLLFFGKLFYRFSKKLFFNLFSKNRWHLAIMKNNLPRISGRKLKIIKSPKGTFWADPFFFKCDDTNEEFIFFEEYSYSRKLGHLSVIPYKDLKSSNVSNSKIIIKENFHLSYPNVFKYNDEYYMIPESSQSNELRLYKSTKFPYDWEFQSTLIDNIKCWDPTLFYKDKKWWLFVNVSEHPGIESTDELFLFYNDILISKEWVSHPLNPIVTDVRTARCAGKIFEYENDIIRPSQNCAPNYGHGLVFNKILELNENSYKEEIIDAVLPNFSRKIIGVHTFNFNINNIVSDCLIKE